jgi:isoleucyl-tRNA synthetase
MTNFYPKITSSPNFPELEKEIIKYWQEHKLFERSVELREFKKGGHNNEFIFYDGPPFANGLPHYGHLLTGFIKDVFARYQTSKGKKVERRFGWDCHGLPAEMQAEKELGLSGRNSIIEYGISKFNEHCAKSVLKYTNEWEKYVTRQARWVDFANSYKTMDKNFMESVIWAFAELYKKGYIYEAMRVMPYSWACQTPLSNFETKLDNSYRQKADKTVTVGFILEDKPEFIKISADEYRILAWTTTPWTLPSNLALAIHPDFEYVAVQKDKCCYILAGFALEAYKKELNISENTLLQKFKGKELEGLKYKPMFDYFLGHKNAFKVLVANFVESGSGTGIVHMSPGFGEDDQMLCQKHDITLVCPVDSAGKFTSEVRDFANMHVFEANDPIIIKLKQQGSWLKTEQYVHNYPHCWRTDTPLIYKALPSWYVKVTAFKDRMVELNKQINWIPSHIKDGMFHNWLEGARDWSISRNRFWGAPIPIWKSDDPKYPRIDVYGSIAELERDFGVKVESLHRPFIDSLVRPNPDDPTGKSMMRRIADVFDCWFESGSVPYAQVHYPFENKQWLEQHLPADFIVEYVAQTRGWFYTLMVLSTALFDKPPFLNCICHGVILDDKGQKLSKRLNNYADPLDIFAQYGSDALRLTMLSSSVVQGQEFLIDKEGKLIYETLRLQIKPIWNAYHFFAMYANADGIVAAIDYSSKNVLDRYILSKLRLSIQTIEKALDNFDTQLAANELFRFFEVLNNWYIRRSRQRFWKSEKDEDKTAAYNTLFTCLEHIMRATASLIPLLSEEIYLGLHGNKRDGSLSVHLADFPKVDNIALDKELVDKMDRVLDVCNAALFIRSSENIRVRQPLSSLTIVSDKAGELADFVDIIKDEVNVKNVVLETQIENFANFKLTINFPVLAKRLPHKVKDIVAANKLGDWHKEENALIIASEKLTSEEFSLKLEPKLTKGSKALNNADGVVILDLEITHDLYIEGIARDLVRFIQQARKDAVLEVNDRIYIKVISESLEINEAISLHQDFIVEQTLGNFNEVANYGYSVFVEELKCEIFISKIIG